MKANYFVILQDYYMVDRAFQLGEAIQRMLKLSKRAKGCKWVVLAEEWGTRQLVASIKNNKLVFNPLFEGK